MAKNYVQEGEVFTLTPTADVAAGKGFLFGANLFGIALADVAANTPGPFKTSGVFDIDKTSALAINQGDRVFWVPASSVVNKTSTSQVCIGVAIASAANPSPRVKVKLGAATPSGT